MTNSVKYLLEKLNQLIEANLDIPIFSTDTICHELGVSRSQLHRILIEQTQLSITLHK